MRCWHCVCFCVRSGLWEQVAVGCHRFAPDCFHWRNGVIGVDAAITVRAEVIPHHAGSQTSSTKIRFSCRGEQVCSIWDVLWPLLQFVEELFESWDGLTVSSSVLCPNCNQQSSAGKEFSAVNPGVFIVSSWRHFVPQKSTYHLCYTCKERIPTHRVQPDRLEPG